MRSHLCRVILGVAMLTALSGAVTNLRAQGLTGQIGGSIVDESRAVIPGATITVRNTATQVTATAVTDANGGFVITNLLAGTYDIAVALEGFRAYEQRGIILTATQRVALPPIALKLGMLAETITVQAEAVRIQTQSGERSAVITVDQLEDRALKGRDPFGTLNVLPGVIDTRNRDAAIPAASTSTARHRSISRTTG